MAELGNTVQVLVGHVPKDMTEIQLLANFRQFAIVDGINILEQRDPSAPLGCCILTCRSREEADKAVISLHSKILPGASFPLQARIAYGELGRLENKLFVADLPKSACEDEVLTIFAKYGKVTWLKILKDSNQYSRGCGYVKFETQNEAVAATEALHQKYKMEGSSVPLCVQWAETEEERHSMSQEAPNELNPNAEHLPGALPMWGNIPPPPQIYYGGPMFYLAPPFYNQPAFRNMPPHYASMGGGGGVTQPLLPSVPSTSSSIGHVEDTEEERQVRRDRRADMSMSQVEPNRLSPDSENHHQPLLGALPMGGCIPPPYYGRGYQTYYGGPMFYLLPPFRPQHRACLIIHPQHGAMHGGGLTPDLSYVPSSSSVSPNGHVKGPYGANLYVEHIPEGFTVDELTHLFQKFGSILSVKMFPSSSQYGFVSYNSPEAAVNAVVSMDGFNLRHKKLSVEFDRRQF